MNFKDFIIGGVIITGHARSGTTLLVSLLDNHPELLVIPVETKFFPALESGRFKKYIYQQRCFSNFKDGGFIKGQFAPPFKYHDLISLYEGYPKAGSDKKKLEAILFSFHNKLETEGKTSNLKAWVEKTPSHWEYFPVLKKWFPGLKMIHLYRDPRDVYASWKKRNPKRSVNYFCSRFNQIYYTVELYKQKSCDIITVRYEDIVNNTKSEISRIANFLNIEESKELFSPTVLGSPYLGNSSHHSAQSGISKKSRKCLLKR